MNTPYTGGTPDMYYSGRSGDLWVEFKFIERIPKTVNVEPNVSGLQFDWLMGRHGEGRNVALIVGCKTGGVIIRAPAFCDPISPSEFVSRMLPRDEIAAWIREQTCAGVSIGPKASRRRKSSNAVV